MVDRIGINEQHVKETVQEKFSIQIKKSNCTHQNKFKMAGDPFCVDKKINYHRLVGQKGQYNTSTSRIHQTC